jgi:sugar-specific transcriptional regulator TrmB
MLDGEKGAREQTEEAILEMLKEMVSKIKNEMEIERTEREENQERLLVLLDDTCQKLNTARQQQ